MAPSKDLITDCPNFDYIGTSGSHPNFFCPVTGNAASNITEFNLRACSHDYTNCALEVSRLLLNSQYTPLQEYEARRKGLKYSK